MLIISLVAYLSFGSAGYDLYKVMLHEPPGEMLVYIHPLVYPGASDHSLEV